MGRGFEERHGTETCLRDRGRGEEGCGGRGWGLDRGWCWGW